MLDFKTQLYTSQRAYVKEIEEGKFVFFSPDNKTQQKTMTVVIIGVWQKNEPPRHNERQVLGRDCLAESW